LGEIREIDVIVRGILKPCDASIYLFSFVCYFKIMKKKASAVVNKTTAKKSYYQETIVEPAERLLKALIEAETKEKDIPHKIRKIAISR